MPVRTYQDKNGVTKTVFEYLRFIDSYRSMGASLEKLVSYLPENKFEILDKVILIILQKSETSYTERGIIRIPTLITLKSSKKRSYHREKNGDLLCNGEVMITDDQWQHAENVYEQFQCANVGDKHYLYLLTDTTLGMRG